jgi:prophage maintenance system killer protein
MWITDNFNKYPCVFHAIKFDIENETVRNSLIDLLIYFIKHEHQRIQKIPDVSGIIAGDYSLRTSHDEKAIIFDIINHMLYNKEDCNVISLVALIVFEINSNHLYSNGNKRTSVATMASVLSYFGYYLYFSATKNEKMFDL